VVIPAACLAVAVAVAFWSAQRTLNRSADIAAEGHRIGFTLQPLDAKAAEAENPGFEPVSATAGYTSGAAVAGNLYLAGPAGLTVVSPDGSVRQMLRTGFELPVAPIVAVVSARLRGASEAQVLLATSGAGVLVLDTSPKGAAVLHQLLPDSAEARDVTALLPLASGELLIGTRHAGVLLYDGAALVPFAATEKQAGQVTALASIETASVAIGTRDTGLFYVHAGTVQHADASSGLPDDGVEALVASGGKLYAGTPLGVAQFDVAEGGLKAERVLAKGVFSHALAVDAAAGELLVGTLEQGLERVPLGGKARLRNADFAVSGGQIGRSVFSFFAANGATYVLMDGKLLSRGAGGWESVLPAKESSLADRNISALAFAPDGSLYVGFFDHGLDVLAATGAVRHFEDDHLFCVNRLVLDPERQTMAAATANGLVLFDRQGTPRQVLGTRDGLIAEHVTDVEFTRTGMTVATPAGLTFLGPSGVASLYAFQGLVNNHVYTLGADGNTLLAGTLGGLSVLQAGEVTRNFTATNSGLKHNWITALAPMPQGGWIVGTYGAGLETMSADGRFERVGMAGDVVVNPNALLVTATHVYAGTLGKGLMVLDRESGRWDVVTRGLPSENVTAFAERSGELYVGTENGLVRIAETKLGGGGR
jgi:ligand-binding sensor domain-containing protein